MHTPFLFLICMSLDKGVQVLLYKLYYFYCSISNLLFTIILDVTSLYYNPYFSKKRYLHFHSAIPPDIELVMNVFQGGEGRGQPQNLCY